MKRALLLTLALLGVPMVVAAQLEIGVDAGLSIESVDGQANDLTRFSIPTSAVRVGFGAGESLIVETLVAVNRVSSGDFSSTSIGLLPGVNFPVGDQFYLRGEAGLQRLSVSLSGNDESRTQYAIGGAAGMRIPASENVGFRVELGLDRWLENEDEGLPTTTEFRVLAGISAVVN